MMLGHLWLLLPMAPLKKDPEYIQTKLFAPTTGPSIGLTCNRLSESLENQTFQNPLPAAERSSGGFESGCHTALACGAAIMAKHTIVHPPGHATRKSDHRRQVIMSRFLEI